MSYIRNPIYIWGTGSELNCHEVMDMKHSLHKDGWIHTYKGKEADDIAFRHMAEHYRKMVDDPDTNNDAMLIYYSAWDRYISSIPILGWLIRRLSWRFSVQYGFEEENG